MKQPKSSEIQTFDDESGVDALDKWEEEEEEPGEKFSEVSAGDVKESDSELQPVEEKSATNVDPEPFQPEINATINQQMQMSSTVGESREDELLDEESHEAESGSVIQGTGNEGSIPAAADNEMNKLRKGMEYLDVQGPVMSHEDNRNESDGTDNALLGGADDDDYLSEFDYSDAEKMLSGNTEQMNVHEDSSSGDFRFYGKEAGNVKDDQVGQQYSEMYNADAEGNAQFTDPDDVHEEDSEVFSQSQKTDTVRSEGLPAFPTIFGKAALNAPGEQGHYVEAPRQGSRMTSVIHPPGTNVHMQAVMKSRLPSTSSIGSTQSEDAVRMSNIPKRQSVEKVMESQINAPPTRNPPANVPRLVQSAGSKVASLEAELVLKLKDINVINMGAAVVTTKHKPLLTISQGSQHEEQAKEDEEPEGMPQGEVHDVETDPFFSGVFADFIDRNNVI